MEHGKCRSRVLCLVLNSYLELVATLSDLKLMLSSLNDMVICCGNNDTKFEELVVLRKGCMHMHTMFTVHSSFKIWNIELLF